MSAQLKAELLKVRSTRTTLGLLIGMVLLTLLIVILTGVLTPVSGLSSEKSQVSLFAPGGIALIFAALAGVLLMTSEYRHDTIEPTFIFTPRRPVVLAAKLLAGLLTGFAFGVIGFGLALGVGSLILSARGIPSALSGGDFALLMGGGIGSVALRGTFGVGLGAIVRNQVAGVIGLLAWDFVVNSLLFGLAPSVGRFMPTPAADALTHLRTAHLLAPASGAAVLVGWTLVLSVLGVVLTLQRDA